MRSIEEIRAAASVDSLAWFPQVHRDSDHFLAHSALGLAGETGEAVDVIKKWHRGGELNVDALGSELADVLIYLLHICTATGIDLEAEYEKKRARNDERFGRK